MKTPLAPLFYGLLAACTSANTAQEIKSPVEIKAAVAQETLPNTLEEAVTSSFRSAQNTPRDLYRHPLETLKFFGIKPTMTVVEISPGAGWYAEILAPYLSAKGRYIAAIVPPEKSAYSKATFERFSTWTKSHPLLAISYGQFSPPETLNIAPPASADMVLTFRNVHNWMSKGAEAQAFAAFYAALKPGGILGVVEHRAFEQGATDPKAESGYVKQSEVIRLATAAGFKLAAKAEINANPLDTKDYPEGVWTLPPTMALKDKDPAKYLAIGESDRMTLRFVKAKN